MISASFAGGSSAGESNTRQRDREFPPRLVRRHRAPGHRRKKGCGPDLQPARLGRPSDFSRGGPSRPPSRAQMAFQPRPLPATSATGRQRVFPDFTRCFGNRSGRLSSLLCGSAPGTGDDCKAFPPPGCGAPSSSSPQKTEDGSATFRPLLRLKGRHEGRSRT